MTALDLLETVLDMLETWEDRTIAEGKEPTALEIATAHGRPEMAPLLAEEIAALKRVNRVLHNMDPEQADRLNLVF